MQIKHGTVTNISSFDFEKTVLIRGNQYVVLDDMKKGEQRNISGDERLAAGDVGEIHSRQLLDGLQRDFLVGTGGSLIAAAHRATCVATICNNHCAI